MLLREDLEYVVLDFETTWTDRKHDEIIQVGITQFDIHWKIIREFSSYVRPIHTEKLHDIIDILTGISIDMLTHAPTRADIHESVASFFTDKTVIIWQSIDFDLAFLKRYGKYDYYTSVDTLPLAQALYPYLPSYALEIIAHHILGKQANHTSWFHDANIDSQITWQVFFQLIKNLEGLLYEQPYLWEITKRTLGWFPQCITYSDNRYLLKDIPLLSLPVPLDKKDKDDKSLPTGTRYAGDIVLDELAMITTKNSMVSAFSHPPKVLLTQKRLVQQWSMLGIHEQHSFDANMLHTFFTKKSYQEREWFCALKYFTHVQQKHKSYHTLNYYDRLFLQTMLSTNSSAPTKRLFTHQEIFNHIDKLSLPPETHIVLYDKEWLFDSWKKRRYSAIDLYNMADILEWFCYKYKLLGNKHEILDRFLASRYIFTWVFTWEWVAFSKDIDNENIRIDNYDSNISFYKSGKVRWHIKAMKDSVLIELDTHDIILFEHAFNSIENILSAPFMLHCKRWQFMQRVTIQKVDTYISWNDIIDFFQWYSVSFLSVLDKKLTPLPLEKSDIPKKQIVKRKDVVVKDKPKICIIAPSKQAANQLIMSLHKSAAYKDCLLAWENITWGTGKIIQQALQKDSYILVGGYGFCLQCIAHSLEFDYICALDIMQWNTINTFMDIEYYATKKI